MESTQIFQVLGIITSFAALMVTIIVTNKGARKAFEEKIRSNEDRFKALEIRITKLEDLKDILVEIKYDIKNLRENQSEHIEKYHSKVS